MLRITKYGEGILTQKGALIEKFDEELIDLADEMVDTMYEAHGIGLAAQQIDKAIMLCVLDVAPDEGDINFSYELDGKKPPIDLIMPMALVNPIIHRVSDDKDVQEEGCLSFPEIHGDVKRPSSIEVEFKDLDGANHSLKCDGIFARCIQHEVDHLNGILFTDRMDSKTRKHLKNDLRRLKEITVAGLKNQPQ